MAARALTQVREEEPAFVLHSYPYRETSLIVEAFTAQYGRVAMVARGAKRPRSELRGLLQAFQPLALSFAGAGELKTLQRAQWRGGQAPPQGSALLCGFYLNELLLKLLLREDAHPALFDAYASALQALAGTPLAVAQGAILRRFEVRLLAELGYALPLSRDADTGEAIDPDARYHYHFDSGPRRADVRVAREPGLRRPLVRGATLIALDTLVFVDADIATEAKHLMRDVLDHHLEERRIFSRRIVRDLQALDEEGVPQ